mmetsp:Transcript_22199/g.62993  ORF Transcript_22199/g.62993 Transcript_22199/m.62993 type:complete len:211 (-) Transcript_22199:3497-4129(-)
MRLVSFPSSVGIVPRNFGLSVRTRKCNPTMSPHSVGIPPAKFPLTKSIRYRFTSWPISLGNVPPMPVLTMEMSRMSVNFPNVVGKLPVNPVLDDSVMFCRLIKLPISLGKEPDNLLSFNRSTFRATNLPNSLGMLWRNWLDPASSSVSCVRSPSSLGIAPAWLLSCINRLFSEVAIPTSVGNRPRNWLAYKRNSFKRGSENISVGKLPLK